MSDHSAAHAELPRSAYLDHTLRRAWNAAEQRSHRYVTLEHLLLALLDDPDAIELLQAVDADIHIIQGSVATAINNNTALVAPAHKPPAFSYKFDNLFAGAFEDAVRAGRKEIDGAFVLVAVAKHPESDASAILAANGFNAQTAQRTLEALLAPSRQTPAPPQTSPPRPSRGEKAAKPKPEAKRAPTPPRPSSAPGLNPAPARQGGSAGSGDRFMEDMLKSVRTILDADAAKDWALSPLLNPAATLAQPALRGGQPRPEPQLRAESGQDQQRAPAPPPKQAAHHAQERASPPPRLDQPPPRPTVTSPALRAPVPANPAGFPEPKAPAFDLELPAAPQPQEKPQEKSQEQKRKSPGPKPSRTQREPAGALAKTLENIPRTLRLARGEIVQIQLGKEEAGQLLARPAQHPRQSGETQTATRAVSIRLSAPEGGFFIETMTPETQWLSSGAGSDAGEPFGNWSWAVVPNETGWRILAVSVSVRDIEANGVLTGSQATEQAIEIRVRTNFSRLFWRSIRALLLLIAGGSLAVGAWYVLKAIGKLPQ